MPAKMIIYQLFFSGRPFYRLGKITGSGFFLGGLYLSKVKNTGKWLLHGLQRKTEGHRSRLVESHQDLRTISRTASFSHVIQSAVKTERPRNAPTLDELNAMYTECMEEHARYSGWNLNNQFSHL